MSNLEGLKVLIVDDDPFMRRTIRAVLRAIDRFVVEEAADGDIALGLIDVFRPDLVLCDVVMPRAGGLEFVAHLRKNPDAALRLTPVIMLTGRTDEATVRDAARLADPWFRGQAGLAEVAGGPLADHLRQAAGDPGGVREVSHRHATLQSGNQSSKQVFSSRRNKGGRPSTRSSKDSGASRGSSDQAPREAPRLACSVSVRPETLRIT